ncbi:hypothetical protein C2G38_2234338 [Gigaspora rosea]|uniref:Uncharacterized protein n=1 Tax=Gigaspora rosea TaxID=44941 RepID=A0A397TUR4_9GLOM|nr:hypothetical protein C2G38_2234338 [Gigaspora rosea]
MDKQAAEFQQLVHEVVGGNYIKDVQFYEDLKIVLEILEDLIDRERIMKNSDKNLQNFRNNKETEYLSLYIKQTAPMKKSCLPQVCTSKLSLTKPKLKRPKELKPVNHKIFTEMILDENKTYSYCQQLAEIMDQKSNERKDSNKLKKSFDSETLNYAYKSWLKRVKDFQNEKKKLKEEKLHYNDSKEPRDASCTGSDMGTKAKVDEPENGTTRPIVL